jgi:hypothetical protein
MPSHHDQGVAMKYKRQDFILIKGGSATQVPGSVEPLRTDQSEVPSSASQIPSAPTAAMDCSAHIPWAAVQQDAPAFHDPSISGAALHGLREFDSFRMTGDAGVVQVGVNDLGWVVYDWVPGP